MRIVLAMIFLCLFLSGCTEGTNYAPVTEVSTIEPLPKNGLYEVQTNDTLYSISWRYGLDYRYLAKMNAISRPYHILVGQRIYLRPSPAQKKAKIKPSFQLPKQPKISPKARPRTVTKKTPEYTEKEPVAVVRVWYKPACGEVIGNFSEFNKGINISGQIGDPILATAPGKVVYSGNGLRAYGNLIIIKHNSTYLSAYAHNNQVLVKEGDWVRAGQRIARMGDTGSRCVMLHFEIRKNGKPVNPLNYLAKR